MPRNKHAAKLARRRTHRPGNLQQLRKMMWQGLVEAEAILLTAIDPEVILRACHALSQCGAQYYKLLEGSEYAERIRQLEERCAAMQAQITPRNGRVHVAPVQQT